MCGFGASAPARDGRYSDAGYARIFYRRTTEQPLVGLVGDVHKPNATRFTSPWFTFMLSFAYIRGTLAVFTDQLYRSPQKERIVHGDREPTPRIIRFLVWFGLVCNER